MLTAVIGPLRPKICKSNIHTKIRTAKRVDTSLPKYQKRLGVHKTIHGIENPTTPMSAEKTNSPLRCQAIVMPAPRSTVNTRLLYHLTWFSPTPNRRHYKYG